MGVQKLDPARAQPGREPWAKEREPVASRRAGHVDVGLGDVDIAVRPHHGDGDAGRAERVALPPHRNGDAADVRQRDVGEEGDVHAVSVCR